MRIKNGDTVLVIAGKEKGKTGRVDRQLPKEGRVVIDGVEPGYEAYEAATGGAAIGADPAGSLGAHFQRGLDLQQVQSAGEADIGQIGDR